MSFTETCQRIVRDPLLSPAQKSHALALAAENALPYPELPAEVSEAMANGFVCDMFEGHAPTSRAMCCRITRSFCARARPGWSWHRRRILTRRSMPCASSTTTCPPSPACRSGWVGSTTCCCPSSVSWMRRPSIAS